MKSLFAKSVLVLWALLPLQIHGWSLNDVSILLPLPTASQVNLLISPQSQGEKEEMLPFEVFSNLPHLVQGMSRQELYQNLLKVVAIRIDPCFFEKLGPFDCRPQIRMVWQPVMNRGDGTITMDAALHTFYDLSQDEWQLLTEELAPYATSMENEALSIHPVIEAQGLNGSHWTDLKKIFLKFAGKQNLSRATAMTVDPIGSIWVFSGVNIDEGFMTRIQIPRVNHVAQAFFADIANLKTLKSDIRPSPNGAPEWLSLITHSEAAKNQMSRAQISTAMEQSLRIENPRLEDTSTMDCVSCHVAQTVRLWGDRNLRFDWKDQLRSSVFSAPEMNLENRSFNPGFINRLRAFGYFIDEPVISQRLIHESAQVLQKIRENVPGIPGDMRRVDKSCEPNLKLNHRDKRGDGK